MRSLLQSLVRTRLDAPRPVKRARVKRGPYVKLIKGRTMEHRFQRKVQKTPEGCWLWLATLHTWMVERVKYNPVCWAYEHFTGNRVPEGSYLRPAACVRPQGVHQSSAPAGA